MLKIISMTFLMLYYLEAFLVSLITLLSFFFFDNSDPFTKLYYQKVLLDWMIDVQVAGSQFFSPKVQQSFLWMTPGMLWVFEVALLVL